MKGLSEDTLEWLALHKIHSPELEADPKKFSFTWAVSALEEVLDLNLTEACNIARK